MFRYGIVGGINRTVLVANHSESPVETVKRELRHRLLESFDAFLRDADHRPTQEQLETRLRALLNVRHRRDDSFPTLTPEEQAALVEEVANEVLGFGPLAPLMEDPTVS